MTQERQRIDSRFKYDSHPAPLIRPCPISRFKEGLNEWLGGGVVRPSHFRNHLQRLLLQGEMADLSVSRPSSRQHWGIPVPGDSNQVRYLVISYTTYTYTDVPGYSDAVYSDTLSRSPMIGLLVNYFCLQ